MSVLHKLLETADVFLTNYRTQALIQMGLDYDTMKERYPRLVWAQALGFGEKGPAKDNPGFDPTAFFARGGMLGTTYQKGTAPINLISAQGDHQVGMGLAGGICAALLAREHTGKGDKVTCSLHGTALYTMAWGIMGVEYGSTYPKSRDNVNVPSINIYQAGDGSWMQLCGGNYNIFYPNIMRALGHPELVDHPDWKDLATIQAKGMCAEVIAFIDQEMKKFTSDEILERFLAENAPIEKCYTFEEVIADQQCWESEDLVKLEYPNGAKHLNVAIPVRLASYKPEYKITRRAGADTMTNLTEIGYTEDEVKAMAEAGVVKI